MFSHGVHSHLHENVSLEPRPFTVYDTVKGLGSRLDRMYVRGVCAYQALYSSYCYSLLTSGVYSPCKYQTFSILSHQQVTEK